MRLLVSYALSIPVLPKGQPHAECHLGGAEGPHPVRLLDEPHPDLARALGADHPKARMLLRSQELYESIPERDYRESLYEPPLPHGVLPFRFRAVSRVRLFYNSARVSLRGLRLTVSSDNRTVRFYAPRGRRYALRMV